jgi:hypothetical protein
VLGAEAKAPVKPITRFIAGAIFQVLIIDLDEKITSRLR